MVRKQYVCCPGHQICPGFQKQNHELYIDPMSINLDLLRHFSTKSIIKFLAENERDTEMLKICFLSTARKNSKCI